MVVGVSMGVFFFVLIGTWILCCCCTEEIATKANSWIEHLSMTQQLPYEMRPMTEQDWNEEEERKL